MPATTVKDMSDKYFISNDYNTLSDKSKVDYKYFMNVLLTTKVDDKQIQEYASKSLTGPQARMAYEQWLDRGVYMANHVCAVARKLYSFGMEMGHTNMNPFATFKRKTVKPRKVVWTQEQITAFLDAAYSDYKYRSVGLIAQMAYEWCQRIGDMRTLKFGCVDLDNRVLNLEQSKRGATVHLPISDTMVAMLQQQKEDFGFQEYVAPYPRPRNAVYSPFTMQRLSRYAREVMGLAGLPDELRIADLRRTGTTEMVEAGVGIAQIMSVTGHANPQSVKPYMKNTLASAEYALTERNKRGTSIISAAKESVYT